FRLIFDTHILNGKLSLFRVNCQIKSDLLHFIRGTNADNEGVWVHNDCDPEFIKNIIKSQKIAPDLLVKGVHFNIGKIELKALPDDKGNVIFKPVFSSYNNKDVEKAISQAQVLLKNEMFRNFLIKHSEAGFKMAAQKGDPKAREFKNLKLFLERNQNENR
ncbi:hypothetical protein LGY16_04280, partial [Mannheimia haemolytica]|nr:hypothetical protein [Mannheimia haemolytica]